MSISNPIDKLVQNLAQEYAKDYWEGVKHFKAQEAQQRKAGEAHQKKQLEYVRSAGIKLSKVEKDQEEGAYKLKSSLEQKRPPLISRPTMRLEDARHAALLGANLGGQLVPPYVGFFPPPDPGVVPPADPSQIKFKAVDDGSGLGWGWSAEAHQAPAPVFVMFSFTPHESTSYSFTACFACHGFYVLQAFDDWISSKDAQVTLDFSLDAFQFVDRGWKVFPNTIDRESQNIDKFENFDQFLNFSDTQNFREGEQVVITARIKFDAIARGGGSHAEINFADGDANFVQPQGLWVSPPP